MSNEGEVEEGTCKTKKAGTQEKGKKVRPNLK